MDAVYVRMTDWLLHMNIKKTLYRFSLEYLRCTYGCFTWRRFTFTFQSIRPNLKNDSSTSLLVCSRTIQENLPGRAWNPVLYVHCSKPESQSSVSLGHPYWICMCIKLLDRDEDCVATLSSQDKFDLLSVFVSICFYCNCSRFISMSMFVSTQAMW